MKMIIYYTSWCAYGPRNFKLSNIDLTGITHVNYAFATVSPEGRLEFTDEWADFDHRNGGNVGELQRLKLANSGIKINLSIGGWTGSGNFSQVCRSDRKRATLISDIHKFLKDYKFDGIDIDWEFPTERGGLYRGHHKDPDAFVTLIEELRKTMGHEYELSAALSATSMPLNMERIAPLLNHVMLMEYDFTGSTYSEKAYHHSNLKGGERNIEKSVQEYITKGHVHPSQIILGIPAYGKPFKCRNLMDPNIQKTELDPIPYYDLARDPNQIWDPLAKASFINRPKEDIFITFDSDTAVAEKTLYTKLKGLGGMFIWEISMDLPSTDQKSILNTIKRVSKHHDQSEIYLMNDELENSSSEF